MTVIDLPPTWRPVPDDLLLDRAIPDPALRLYALLHWCGWKRRDIANIEDLASLYPVSKGSSTPGRSTMYRWLHALEAGGWITFVRQPGQKRLGDRIALHPKPVPLVGQV